MTVEPELLKPNSSDHKPSQPRGSRIISHVLPPAVRLWLHTQVERVEDLDCRIEGSDRQILSGYIPKVFIAARRTVYQGLYLSQARLSATEIRINLRQILQGKPFQLLEAIPVVGEIVLDEADLNASLQAPLLVDGLNQFLATLFQAGGASESLADLMGALCDGETPTCQDPKALINADQLTLSLSPVSKPEADSNPLPIVIRTSLRIRAGHILILKNPHWLPGLRARQGFPLEDLDGFELDLGPEVDIQELRLEPNQIIFGGRINVAP